MLGPQPGGRMKTSPAARLKENEAIPSLDIVREFHSALTSRSLENVRQIVEAHPGILGFTNSYGTVLHHACAVSTVDIVEYFLAQGFAVDEPHPLVRRGVDHTPLFEALRNSDTSITRLLVERGANVNAGGGRSQTPLHVAALYNDDESIQYLLGHGANPGFLNEDGLTPLAVATKGNRDRAAAVLKEHGAPLNGIVPEGTTVSIHLSSWLEPVRQMFDRAVAAYREEHSAEPLTAFALYADAVTGFVAVCLDTGEFPDVPSMKYAFFEKLEVPEWRNAYLHARKIVITSTSGKVTNFRVGKDDDEKFDKLVFQFLVELLKEISATDVFAALPTRSDFRIGVDMMEGTYGKFWKMKKAKAKAKKPGN